MITKTLKIGDYIFTAQGYLARITKINKQTYSYAKINSGYNYDGNIGFNGIRKSYYGNEEWFECDNVQAKALELAIKNYKVSINVHQELKQLKELIGKAKFFLNQVEDIDEIEVEEERQ